MCLWNNDYLFVGCDDTSIKLVELKKGIVFKSLNSHNTKVLTVKKIILPQYGEVIISQGYDSHLKLWVNV